MLKGCQKKIIFLKDTGSRAFDEAYFVINPSYEERADFDIVSEATKIVNGTVVSPPRKKRGNVGGTMLFFCLGSIFGAVLTAIIALIL